MANPLQVGGGSFTLTRDAGTFTGPLQGQYAKDSELQGGFLATALPGVRLIQFLENPAQLLPSVVVDSGPGSYVTTGFDAEVVVPGVLQFDAGAYSTTESDVSFSETIFYETGSYSTTGTTFDFSTAVSFEPGAYSTTGADVAITSDAITFDFGVYLTAGFAATVIEASAVSGTVSATSMSQTKITSVIYESD